jgi:phage terminase small subunit
MIAITMSAKEPEVVESQEFVNEDLDDYCRICNSVAHDTEDCGEITPQVVEQDGVIDAFEYNFSGNTVTVNNKRRFIEAYRETSTVYHAAQVAGISRKTAYAYLHDDPAFAEAMADCQEDVTDVMETSVYQRALGTHGHKPDTLLTMFWLKAKRPQFRDKLAVDVVTIQNQVKEFIGQILQGQVVANSTANSIDTQQSKKETQLLTTGSDDPQ